MHAVALLVAVGLSVPTASRATPTPADPVCAAPSPVPGTALLVGVTPQASTADVLASLAGLGARVAGGVRPLHIVEVTLPTAAAARVALTRLKTDPDVRWAEPEGTFHVNSTPSDPLFGEQWGLAKVQAPVAWRSDVGTSAPVTVAVLDTGVDLGHPDFEGRVVSGLDTANNDADSSDDHFHGTHVAGIIAAATNNRRGVAGMSWGAKVLAVKVMDKNGTGSECDIVAGMVYAAQQGAKVENLSLGGRNQGCPLAMQEAIAFARQRGTLIVAAAGNDAKKGNPVNYPGGCAGVLTVGATDSRDRVATFSEHGPQVVVSAPGVHILSTFRTQEGQHKYAYLDGTSMATPFVAGLAALLFSQHPDWTPDQVFARIVSTTDDLGRKGRDDYYGAGRINAARALHR
jgi:subtilisin family serine protease